MRLHGNRDPQASDDICGGPNELWSFGSEIEVILVDFLRIREKLRPYIMRMMEEASVVGIPPMRPLALLFPEESEAWSCDDQFMFGSDILVAPVLEKGARHRSLWLPSGNKWMDPWSGGVFEGGVYATVDAPLDQIPLFLREGSHELMRIFVSPK